MTATPDHVIEEVGRHFEAPNHAATMFRRVRSFRASRHLCDVTLVASGHPGGGPNGGAGGVGIDDVTAPPSDDVTDDVGVEIGAHRLVLAAASDYFAAMFTNDRLVEARSSRVSMRDVFPSALVDIVNYIYSGVIELKEDNVENILATAGLLQLPDLVDACCTFFVKQLHPSNCCGIRSFADAQGCLDLLKAADSYIIDNFLDVIQHQEFLLLPLAQVTQLLSSEDLNVDSEEVVFHSMLRWICYDLPARKPLLATLLECIKLPLLPPQFISEHIEYNALFKSSMKCQELVMEALMFNLMPERRFTTFDRKKMKPRKSTLGTLYAIGGMDFSRGATGIERYSYRKDEWCSVGELRGGKRLQFGAAVIGAKIFVVGGRDGLKTLSTMECYDPLKNIWTSLAPMMTPRHGLGVAVLEGPLYAVGGHDGWSYLNTVERWDPQVKTWSFVAQMTIPRSTVGVVSLGYKLYAVGGRDGNNCLQSVETYDPYSNKWTLCAPMSVKRGCVGVATCNGFIFAVGGHQSSSKTLNALFYDCAERYDPKTDTWTTVCCMNIPRDAVGLCSLGPDVVIAVGGYDGQNYLKSVEVYDPFTNEWTFLASLNAGRAGTCVVCVPNSPGLLPPTPASKTTTTTVPAISITVNDDHAPSTADIHVTATAGTGEGTITCQRVVNSGGSSRDPGHHSPFHCGPTYLPPEIAVVTNLMDDNFDELN